MMEWNKFKSEKPLTNEQQYWRMDAHPAIANTRKLRVRRSRLVTGVKDVENNIDSID